MIQKKKSPEDITRIEDLAPFEHALSESEESTETSPPDFTQDIHFSQEPAQEALLEKETPPESPLFEDSIDSFQFTDTADDFDTQEVAEEVSAKVEIRNTQELSNQLKTELDNMQIEHVPLEGVPPFTIIINHIKSETDKIYLRSTLKKMGFYKDAMSGTLFDRSLERGVLQISQLSEFVANYLYQEVRKTAARPYVFMGAVNEGGETSSSENLNETLEETFPLSEQMIIHSGEKIPGHEIIETLGPLMQTLWISEPKRDNFFSDTPNEENADYAKLPTIKQEIRLRKGNALINWKSELIQRGEFRGKKILCTGIIVRVVKL
jgi:hypothetical protein